VTPPRYLVDTHLFLWAVNGDPRLAAEHAEILQARRGLIISAASIWEIAIKRSTNKLRIDGDILEVIRARAIPILPINEVHAARVEHLPHHHRDPFDRLLIAQAQVEGLTLMTSDRHLSAYGVPVL
jgi:PIN domain nuclease of toxin-antitoxin system